MSEDLERSQSRLNNILTAGPLLSALRTISMGSWKSALKQKSNVQHHREKLMSVISSLMPHLQVDDKLHRIEHPNSERIIALIIGSERGLCGRFNSAIANWFNQYIESQSSHKVRIELWVLGSRLNRIFDNQSRFIAWSGTLTATALPTYRFAFDLTRNWLNSYESIEIDVVKVFYNVYQGAGHYQPSTIQLIPPLISTLGNTVLNDSPWPPLIIETNPLRLYQHIIEQLISIKLYECLIESAAAEHSVRFQLMEEATKNADRLTDELTIVVQAARRHSITKELQELATGAGLLDI